MPRDTTVNQIGAAAIAAAARALRAGRLVAFPTETVYGLGADATSDSAVAAIYAAKGRPRFNPLIVHVASFAAAEKLVVFDARARRLARRFWPGPLTLVLPRRKDCPVSWLASAGLDCLAIRIPDHRVALALLRATRRPVVAPSANRSGRVSPTCAAHVARDLGRRVHMILDGGASRVGVESTVIDLTAPRAILLRPGGAETRALETALGQRLARPRARKAGRAPAPHAPGQLASHYAPRAAVRLASAGASCPGSTREPLRAARRGPALGPPAASRRGLSRLRQAARGNHRADPQPQRDARSGGSRRQSLRDAARPRPARRPVDRRRADPAPRPRSGDQRSARARRRAADLRTNGA